MVTYSALLLFSHRTNSLLLHLYVMVCSSILVLSELFNICATPSFECTHLRHPAETAWLESPPAHTSLEYRSHTTVLATNSTLCTGHISLGHFVNYSYGRCQIQSKTTQLTTYSVGNYLVPLQIQLNAAKWKLCSRIYHWGIVVRYAISI